VFLNTANVIILANDGEQAFIVCPYAKGYEKAYKGFYKGNYKDYDVILQSNGGETSVSGRFSLRDDGKMRSLTVTIRNLRMEDAGRYICRAGYGYIKQIHLNVITGVVYNSKQQSVSSTVLYALLSLKQNQYLFKDTYDWFAAAQAVHSSELRMQLHPFFVFPHLGP
uniref:Immunoglobulin domain-containing protein n=1 Tax=Sinocyclocheilus rhinocerous TaxID=307959 RepID=A0A673FPC1_9TELE